MFLGAGGLFFGVANIPKTLAPNIFPDGYPNIFWHARTPPLGPLIDPGAVLQPDDLRPAGGRPARRAPRVPGRPTRRSTIAQIRQNPTSNIVGFFQHCTNPHDM